MLATMSAPSLSTPAMTRRSAYGSRGTNSAGGPLPLIPRRTSATRSVPGVSSSSTAASSFSSSTVPFTTVTSPSTSPLQPQGHIQDGSSSDSGSSSDNYLSIRPKRVRGVRHSSGVRMPEASTPAPSKVVESSSSRHSSSEESTPRPRSRNTDDDATPRPSSSKSEFLYSPGKLRLSLDGLKPRTLSESDMATWAKQPSQSAPLEKAPVFIRKKSGEPLRSSLKGSRAKVRGSLSLVTDSLSMNSIATKSEPATPNSLGRASVQFNDKLEQVKLFFAEQKPLAVSRDGSPTDDTSGTDNDFPSWIYGDGVPPAQSKMKLVMKVQNKPPMVDDKADVTLEELSLSPDNLNIIGNVRVRNMAFQKWVAIRFTFDSWQTTSEVSGKYSESISPQFDRFTFSIKLNDLMARIEGKTLQLAVRFSIEGKEMWDNNHGRNYLATFTKAKPKPRLPIPRFDDEADSPVATQFGDLHSKLEKVANKQDDEPSSLPSLLSASLKSRYDFSTSLKSTWRSPTPDIAPPRHSRMQSYPSSIPFPSVSLASPPPKAKPTLGSPRDLSEAWNEAPFRSSSLDSEPAQRSSSNGRHHQRGYFDIKSMETSSMKRTPPGTPRLAPLEESTSLSPRHHSFPPLTPPAEVQSAPALGTGEFPFNLQLRRLQRDSSDSSTGSTLSTPSIVSPSSTDSLESSPSPSESFILSPDSETLDYSQFINKFCFFTGAVGSNEIEPVPSVHRCSSTSSVEELLGSPRTPVFPKGLFTPPTRSTSLDSMTPSPVTVSPRTSFADLRSETASPTTPRSFTRISSPSTTSPSPTPALVSC